MDQLRVVLLGAGRVGRDVARLLDARPGFRVVAVHSRDSALAGTPIGGVTVTSEQAVALATPADAAVIATSSFLAEVVDDVRAAVEAGLNVISTAEELAFPWSTDQALADELDALARARGVSVLGRGVNPGFLFDTLVLTLTGAAWDVRQIETRRVVNLSAFSRTVLGRLGVGFAESEFESGVAAGKIHGHIGFAHTIRLVANALGSTIVRLEETLSPLLADGPLIAEHLKVDRGETAGFLQRVEGVVGNNPWFRAELVGHLDPEGAGYEPEDTIAIDGYAPVRASLRPGLDAQKTVAAVVANSLPRLVGAHPGLLTVADLPPAVAQPTLRDRLVDARGR